jgi:hypothetical protein
MFARTWKSPAVKSCGKHRSKNRCNQVRAYAEVIEAGPIVVTDAIQRNGYGSRALATMIGKTFDEQRVQNLKAMRSPASFVLAGGALLAVLMAIVFYDHPVTDDPILLTHLRGAISSTIE